MWQCSEPAEVWDSGYLSPQFQFSNPSGLTMSTQGYSVPIRHVELFMPHCLRLTPFRSRSHPYLVKHCYRFLPSQQYKCILNERKFYWHLQPFKTVVCCCFFFFLCISTFMNISDHPEPYKHNAFLKQPTRLFLFLGESVKYL